MRTVLANISIVTSIMDNIHLCSEATDRYMGIPTGEHMVQSLHKYSFAYSSLPYGSISALSRKMGVFNFYLVDDV